MTPGDVVLEVHQYKAVPHGKRGRPGAVERSHPPSVLANHATAEARKGKTYVLTVVRRAVLLVDAAVKLGTAAALDATPDDGQGERRHHRELNTGGNEARPKRGRPRKRLMIAEDNLAAAGAGHGDEGASDGGADADSEAENDAHVAVDPALPGRTPARRPPRGIVDSAAKGTKVSKKRGRAPAGLPAPL